MPNTQEETTLILLKPDCVRKNLSGTILKRFLSEGFRLRGIKMIQLDEPVLREHYAHILDLVINGEPLFPKLLDFMTGTDSMMNICHASDSRESAAVELARFFREEELFDGLN